ncbi:MAG: cation:proton antiporter [Candidatus Aenigmatarchaeota archaeon]
MIDIIYLLTIVFVTSTLVLFVFKRFSHPTTPAYIIAGILSGIFIAEEGFLDILQWGIAFVVFMFGIKLEPGRLKHVVSGSLFSTIIQIVVVGSMAFGLSTLIGLDLMSSVYVTIAATLSSSLIGTGLVKKSTTIDLLHGRLAESIDLMEDTIGIFLIILLSSIFFETNIVTILSISFVMLLISLTFRKFIFPIVFKLSDGSEELMMATGLSLLVFMMYLSETMGISIVVGAFLAGISFSHFPYNIELEETMRSLSYFFTSLLFFSLGAILEFPNLDSLLIALIIITMTVLLKPIITAIALMGYGYNERPSYISGFNLDQVSEIAIVISIQAFLVGKIQGDVFNGIILASIVTMITTYYTDYYSEEISNFLSNRLPLKSMGDFEFIKSNIPDDIENHIIIAGYDVLGQMIADFLEEKDKDFVVIEHDPEKLNLDREPENYIFADAMDELTWEKLNYKDADMIISTIPFFKVSLKISSLETDATKIVRLKKSGMAPDLMEIGADYVMTPNQMASDQLIDLIRSIMESDEDKSDEIRKQFFERILEDEDF